METVPVDSERWRFQAAEHSVEDHLGRRSLRLRTGIATVADADIRDGVIDVELAFGDARGFMGPVWRVRDAGNLEWFFLRPHQSGNPDATQYTPAFNGSVGWQLYHGDRYTVTLAYRFDEWLPLRIAFRDERAEIFVGDLEAPALVVDDLKRVPEPGSVGISVGGFAPAWISRFAFSAEPPTIASPRRPPQRSVEGAFPEWSVSDAIAEASLGDAALDGRSWTRHQAEPTGLLDLARVNSLGEGRDTALARVVLHSDRERTKRLDFGFSDRVRVYLERRLLYAGDDRYRSRDYRFLGSIGYFDSLYLPLKAGPNELILAVTEEFGGWGVQARLDDWEGLTIEA